MSWTVWSCVNHSFLSFPCVFCRDRRDSRDKHGFIIFIHGVMLLTHAGTLWGFTGTAGTFSYLILRPRMEAGTAKVSRVCRRLHSPSVYFLHDSGWKKGRFAAQRFCRHALPVRGGFFVKGKGNASKVDA